LKRIKRTKLNTLVKDIEKILKELVEGYSVKKLIIAKIFLLVLVVF